MVVTASWDLGGALFRETESRAICSKPYKGHMEGPVSLGVCRGVVGSLWFETFFHGLAMDHLPPMSVAGISASARGDQQQVVYGRSPNFPASHPGSGRHHGPLDG